MTTRRMPACHSWPAASRGDLVAAWKAKNAASPELIAETEALGWFGLAETMRKGSPEPGDSELLRLWQDRRCAVCGFPDVRALVEDHDWNTGLTRGYLCRSCNTHEGFAGDEEPWVTYRDNPPTSILGLRIEYVNPFGGPTTREHVSEETKKNAAGKLHIPYVQLTEYLTDDEETAS